MRSVNPMAENEKKREFSKAVSEIISFQRVNNLIILNQRCFMKY